MKPSDILCGEHRLIEQVLNCLENITDACARDNKLDGRSACEAVAFFRNFANPWHYRKEEWYFYPVLEVKGFAQESGPMGTLLSEHESGRSFIEKMNDSLEAASSGDLFACMEFVLNALRFIDLVREHIRKEEHGLFGIANQVFDESDQHKILEAFAHLEDVEIGAALYDKYKNYADDLADRWNVERADASEGVCRLAGTW